MLIAEHSMCQPGRPGPIAVSHDGSPGFGRLPQREVADVVLAVFVGLDPLPDPEALGIEAGQDAVGRPRRDPEEDRAVVGPVGVAAFEQRLDEGHDLVDVAGRARQDIRGRHPERRRVGQEGGHVPLGEGVGRLAGRGRAADDLVVDVGDVHHPGHRVAAPAQVADEQVGEQERAEVADMGRPVDRRSARVDADPVVAQRHERARLPRQRVVQPKAHRAASTVATTSAEIDRPAPSAPSRLPLEALTLTAPGSTLEQGRDRLAHRVEVSAEPGARADDGRIDGGGSPAGRREPPTDLADQERRCRSRAGCVRRPGRADRGRRARPPRAARRRRHGAGRRHRSDRRAPARRRSRPRRDAAAPRVRTGGCRGRSRCASPARRSSAPAARRRSAGSVTLRLSGSPGTTWTAIPAASSSAASSVNVSGPSAGNVRQAARSRSRRAPCGVWAAPSPSRSTVPMTRSPSIRLSVSATGTIGSAAPYRAVASATAAIRAASTSGRAASWTRTTPDSSDRSRSRARNPAWTDSWRRAPPATTSTTLAGSQAAAAIPARRSSAVTTTSRPTSGAAARASSVQARSGRPPTSVASLSMPPMRVDRPAATTMASARTAGAGAFNRDAAGRRSSGRRRSGAPG